LQVVRSPENGFRVNALKKLMVGKTIGGSIDPPMVSILTQDRHDTHTWLVTSNALPNVAPDSRRTFTFIVAVFCGSAFASLMRLVPSGERRQQKSTDVQ